MTTFVYVTEYSPCENNPSVEGVYVSYELALAAIQKYAAENIAEMYEGEGLSAEVCANPANDRPMVKVRDGDGHVLERWMIWQMPLQDTVA